MSPQLVIRQSIAQLDRDRIQKSNRRGNRSLRLVVSIGIFATEDFGKP
jgi:hypothetical protein